MVSGPQTTSINNSGLGKIKRILTGGTPFLGGERFLVFGTEFHYRCLERKKGKWRPQQEGEAESMSGMVKSLHTCKIFLDTLPGAIVEKTIHKTNAFGIHAMHGTLDIRKVIRKGPKKIRRIIDLKTTSAETEAEFLAKAIKLAYPRQLVVYDEISPEEVYDSECYIIGVSKKNIGTIHKPKYPHWVFDLNNYTNEKRRSEKEAQFLLTFYKNYGFPTKTGTKEKPGQYEI